MIKDPMFYNTILLGVVIFLWFLSSAWYIFTQRQKANSGSILIELLIGNALIDYFFQSIMITPSLFGVPALVPLSLFVMFVLASLLWNSRQKKDKSSSN